MTSSITTRETTNADPRVTNKGAPLTNAEVDASLISLTLDKLEVDNNLSDVASTSTARSNLGLEIGVDVQAYDADTAKYDDATANFTGDLQQGGSSVLTADNNNIAKYNATTANFTGTLQNGGSDVLVASDIGSTVQAFDSTILTDSDIGSTVQAFDANTAKYDATTANFTGTLQNNGSNVVTDADIGSTVAAADDVLKVYDVNGTQVFPPL